MLEYLKYVNLDPILDALVIIICIVSIFVMGMICLEGMDHKLMTMLSPSVIMSIFCVQFYKKANDILEL